MSVGGNPLALLELDRTLDPPRNAGATDPRRPATGRRRARPTGRTSDRLAAGPQFSPRSCSSRSAGRSRHHQRCPTASTSTSVPSTSRNEWASSTVGGSSSSRTRCCAPRCSTASSPRNAAARTGSSRTRSPRPATRIVPPGTWVLRPTAPTTSRRPHSRPRAACVRGGAATGAVTAFEAQRALTAAQPERARRLFLAGRAGVGCRRRRIPRRSCCGRPPPTPIRSTGRSTCSRWAWRSGGTPTCTQASSSCGRRASAPPTRFPREAVALLSGASALLAMQGRVQRVMELGERAVEVAERSDELARLGARGHASHRASDRRRPPRRGRPGTARRVDTALPLVTVPELLDSIHSSCSPRCCERCGRKPGRHSIGCHRPRVSSGWSACSASRRPSTRTSTGAPATGPTPRADAAVDIEQNAARQPGNAFFGHAVLALVRGLGLYESAGTRRHAALEQSRRIGMQMLEIWARAALGFLAVTRVDFRKRGRPARVGLGRGRGGIGRRSGGAVVAGRPRRGVRHARPALRRSPLAPVPRRADGATVRGWGAGVEARVRGLIVRGGLRVAGAAFRDSAQRFDDLGAPFEAARSPCSPQSFSASTTRGGRHTSSSSRPQRSPHSVLGPGSSAAAERADNPGLSVIRATSVAGKLTRSELRVAVEVAVGAPTGRSPRPVRQPRGPSRPIYARSFASSSCSRGPSWRY